MNKDFSSNEVLNAATLLLFLFFACSTFCTVLCIDEHQTIPAIILGFCGAIFLALTIWSNQKPFISILIGFVFYILFVVTLIFFFPKVIVEGIGIAFFSPYIYLTLGFLGFCYVISTEYKKLKK